MRIKVNDPALSALQTLPEKYVNYHISCFSCLICGKLLSKGDEFTYVNNGIYCKNDVERHINLVPNSISSDANQHLQNHLLYDSSLPKNAHGSILIVPNNMNSSSFSSSPVSSASSTSSMSSISSTNMAYQQQHQQQIMSNGSGASNGQNLYSPVYQYTKQQQMQQQALSLNKMNTILNTPNNTNSNSSFNSFQSNILRK